MSATTQSSLPSSIHEPSFIPEEEEEEEEVKDRSDDSGNGSSGSESRRPPPPPPPPPTFDPAIQGRPYTGRPSRHSQYLGPNVLSVPNPRKWGLPDTNNDVVVSQVASERPESDTSTEVARPSGPSRPSSAPPTPPAVVTYVSSEDEAEIVGTPVPEPKPYKTTPESLGQDFEKVVTEFPKVAPPAIQSVDVDGESLSEAGRPKRQGYKYRGPGAAGAWWKKDPHPAYSHEFADRRLLVTFPFPIRLEQIKPMLLDHFSVYGEIRCAVYQNPSRESAEKAIVVFAHAQGVEKCLADPDRTHCQMKSPRHLSRFDIAIERISSHALTRTVFIKLNGPRSDARARSASPPVGPPGGSKVSGPNDKRSDFQVMPPQVTIWAMPCRPRRTNRLEWWARTYVNEGPDAVAIRKAREETGNEPLYLDTVYLTRRVEERNIVPQLCDFFADLVDIIPPTSRDQGWLVCVSGQRDAERIMNEIGCIPGITARWATEADRADNQTTPNRSPRSPLARLENYSGEAIARAQQTSKASLPPSLPSPTSPPSASSHQSLDSQQPRQSHPSKTPSILSRNSPQTAPSNHSRHSNNSRKTQSRHTVMTRSVPPMTPPRSPEVQAQDLPSEYPHLRKAVAPTYRGRLLKIEMVDGAKRYVDESAVFIGRLVKNLETEVSLLERFSQYGPVCDIEYKPKNATSTYGTGRVLYADPESAARAIHYQDGAISNGSGLKVELRKVLPQDVKMKTLYLDELGRPVSPSIMNQYSPHQVPKAHMSTSMHNTPPLPANFGPQMLQMPQTPRTPMMDPPLPATVPPFQFQGEGGMGMPFPPNFWPVYMGGPNGPPHLPQYGPVQPGPMFIGYPGPPPPAGSMMDSPNLTSRPPQNHTSVGPMSTPPMFPWMHNLGYLPIYPQIPQAQPRNQPQLHPQSQTNQQPPPSVYITPEPSYRDLTTPQEPVSPIDGVPPIDPPHSPSAPKIMGYKSEKGVFKVVYDPEDVRRYQQEQGSECDQEVKTEHEYERGSQPEQKQRNGKQDETLHQPQPPVLHPQTGPLGERYELHIPYQTYDHRPTTPDRSNSVTPPFERPRTSPGRIRETNHPSQLRRASLAPTTSSVHGQCQGQSQGIGQTYGQGQASGPAPNQSQGENHKPGQGQIVGSRGTPVPIPFIQATPTPTDPFRIRLPPPPQQYQEQQYRSYDNYGPYPRYVPFEDPAIVQGPPGGPPPRAQGQGRIVGQGRDKRRSPGGVQSVDRGESRGSGGVGGVQGGAGGKGRRVYGNRAPQYDHGPGRDGWRA